MICANVRSGGSILQIFIIKKYLQNLKYNAKRMCIFHLFLVGIPSILILSVKNRGWGLLNRENLLIVTKVICRQFLIVYSVLTLT